MLDGYSQGSTPVVLSVAHGVHTLVLKHPDAIDEQRQVSVAGDTTVNVRMWLRRPTAMLLKPTYPGATIADVGFLEDGRLVLSMSVPARSMNAGARALREPWIFDPTRGSMSQFTTEGPGLQAVKVAVSPDGRHVAYVQPDASESMTSGASARLTVVCVANADTTLPVRVFAAPSGNGNTTIGSASGDIGEVHDLTWTPDGHHLLVTVRLAAIEGGNPPGPKSRLLLVDASPEQLMPPVELLTLPAELVAGSYIWAPDGNWVAFLTQAPNGSGGNRFVALCALDPGAAPRPAERWSEY